MSLDFPNVSLSETTLDAFQNPVITSSPQTTAGSGGVTSLTSPYKDLNLGLESSLFSSFASSKASTSPKTTQPLYCVTIFGFPKERTSEILDYVGKIGDIFATKQGKGKS